MTTMKQLIRMCGAVAVVASLLVAASPALGLTASPSMIVPGSIAPDSTAKTAGTEGNHTHNVTIQGTTVITTNQFESCSNSLPGYGCMGIPDAATFVCEVEGTLGFSARFDMTFLDNGTHVAHASPDNSTGVASGAVPEGADAIGFRVYGATARTVIGCSFETDD